MTLPRHIAFIMDGNGRWATLRKKPRTFGHSKGSQVIRRIVEKCFNSGIEVVSLYAFSTENWSRPKEEVDKIFSLLKKFIDKYTNTLIKNKARLLVSGDVNALPADLKNSIEKVEELTGKFSDHVLNIAINYGARAEIVRAVQKLLKENVTTVTEQSFSEYLYTAGLPDVDMIVRTSGEKRISNFLLYQSAYAELYFTDVLWPDFNVAELEKALEWFNGRKRRYGNVK
ncbi:MAG TPA: di-trans,poly-cis-decaprenylcistransferase [Clostridiales bacterium]|nr:di-trans,poly-cis-decaprenylcistransferase [Clostridiales bacterium]HBJ98108.1 di-trans,poly-cis-decaprenylcistransferase [Clostridiales bacterium]